MASSSSATAFSSMMMSASMTSSASETSLFSNAVEAFSIAIVTSSEISTRRDCTSSRVWWKTSRIAAPFLRSCGVRPRRFSSGKVNERFPRGE